MTALSLMTNKQVISQGVREFIGQSRKVLVLVTDISF